jgi:phage terminase small subunit
MPPTADVDRKLSLLQSRFVHEYLIDGNATQAAIRAGYSPKSATPVASRLLTRRNVSAAIQTAEAERTALRVQESDARALVPVSYVVDMLRENLERAMRQREVLDRDGKPIGEWQYNGAVANKALELLGKAIQLFSDEPRGARPQGPTVHVSRVEVYLDGGRGAPPVLETTAVVDAPPSGGLQGRVATPPPLPSEEPPT